MRKGDNIGGYVLIDDLRIAGGANGFWGFANKNGSQYFIKQFISPVWPSDSASMPERVRQRRRSDCQIFEQSQNELISRLRTIVRPGGNIVYPVDFFRRGTKYYKVTEKIEPLGLSSEEIARLPIADRILIILTLIQSVDILHRLEIVHADLKMDNVLIKVTSGGGYISKLIDLDNSFLFTAPPTAANGADDVYLAPEGHKKNILGPEAMVTISEKIDIFALGLLAHEYLVGSLPNFRIAQYPGEALLNHLPLRISPTIPAPLWSSISRMLRPAPEARPTAGELLSEWQQFYRRARRGDFTEGKQVLYLNLP